MAKIQLLDKSVAELIAAGEVVERPASIVKELVENAVDAGATRVEVDIEGGGVSLIRVRDNGCGIEPEEIPTAFLRHATSKVRTANDLEAIGTLGFRGEALAAIAAMCRVSITTRTAGREEGRLCRFEGGELVSSEPAGCPVGTAIEVRDVFYNTPARMKFLKKDVSEGTAVAQVVDKCALGHPEIAFRLNREGQVKLRTSGGGDLLAVIGAVYGRDFAGRMRPVDFRELDSGIRVSGYVSDPSGAKPSRTYQNFFLNARYIRTRTAMAALEEAFRTIIPGGRYPACVLNIELPLGLVDVNVHPAKLEVRFANEKPVFQAVYFAVKGALGKLSREEAGESAARSLAAEPADREPARAAAEGNRPQGEPAAPPEHMTAQEFRVLFGEELDEQQRSPFAGPLSLGASRPPDIYVHEETGNGALEERGTGADTPVYDAIFPKSARKSTQNATNLEDNEGGGDRGDSGEGAQEGNDPVQVDFGRAQYRLIGELFGTYILLERGEELVLVDKHAAHERMLYEKLMEDIEHGDRQVLLAPVRVTLAREEHDALTASLERLEQIGFGVEDFGGTTVIVREVPVELGEKDIAFVLAEIADKLRSGNRDLTPTALERLYFNIACKSALRARDKNTGPELAAIVDKLEQNPQITHCPHGRPVRIAMDRNEIEKLFGRIP